MSYKPHPHENPAGADPPAVRFQWSQKQVLLVLLGFASLYAVWHYCQLNLIAPREPVTWQPFSSEIAESAEGRQSGLLILVSSSRTAGEPSAQGLLESVDFRKAVYRARSATLQIDPASENGIAGLEWLSARLREHGMQIPADFDLAGGDVLLVALPGNRREPAIAVHRHGGSPEAVLKALFD